MYDNYHQISKSDLAQNLNEDSRLRNVAIIGKSGVGKKTLLQQVFPQGSEAVHEDPSDMRFTGHRRDDDIGLKARGSHIWSFLFKVPVDADATKTTEAVCDGNSWIAATFVSPPANPTRFSPSRTAGYLRLTDGCILLVDSTIALEQETEGNTVVLDEEEEVPSTSSTTTTTNNGGDSSSSCSPIMPARALNNRFLLYQAQVECVYAGLVFVNFLDQFLPDDHRTSRSSPSSSRAFPPTDPLTVFENYLFPFFDPDSSRRLGRHNESLPFSPSRGEVVFGSTLLNFGFTIPQFAEMYAKKFPSLSKTAVSERLWGHHYYYEGKWYKTAKIKIKVGNGFDKGQIVYEEKEVQLLPAFVQFVLEPIWKLVQFVNRRDFKGIDSILHDKLGIKVPEDVKYISKHRISDPVKERKKLLSLILSAWLPLSSAIARGLHQHLPSPGQNGVIFPDRISKITHSSFSSNTNETVLKEHATEPPSTTAGEALCFGLKLCEIFEWDFWGQREPSIRTYGRPRPRKGVLVRVFSKPAVARSPETSISSSDNGAKEEQPSKDRETDSHGGGSFDNPFRPGGLVACCIHPTRNKEACNELLQRCSMDRGSEEAGGRHSETEALPISLSSVEPQLLPFERIMRVLYFFGQGDRLSVAHFDNFRPVPGHIAFFMTLNSDDNPQFPPTVGNSSRSLDGDAVLGFFGTHRSLTILGSRFKSLEEAQASFPTATLTHRLSVVVPSHLQTSRRKDEQRSSCLRAREGEEEDTAAEEEAPGSFFSRAGYPIVFSSPGSRLEKELRSEIPTELLSYDLSTHVMNFLFCQDEV